MYDAVKVVVQFLKYLVISIYYCSFPLFLDGVFIYNRGDKENEDTWSG